MTLTYRAILMAILLNAAPNLTYADSLRCDGRIISPGDTEKQLLDACGNPQSSDGADWLYEMPGYIPVVVTIQGGVVAFIRNLEESEAFSENPLGDHL